MRWNRLQAGPIGIDIGARGVRAVQFVHGSGGPQVHAVREVPLEPGAAHDLEAVKGAIRETLREGRFRGRWVVACLPAGDVDLRSIRLPRMPEEDLCAAAEFEVRERFPHLQDEHEIRILPAGAVGHAGDEQHEVIVLAVPQAVIADRLHLFGDLGLLVQALEPPTHAFFRPFERFLQRTSDEQQANAFVDLGRRSSRVMITRGREIAFLKACPIGGETIDAAIADKLQKSPREAERLRYAPPSEEGAAAEAVEAMRPVLDQLAREITLCLRYYVVTFRGERPESITCGGSEARCAQLIEILSHATHLPFRVGHALRGMSCGTAFDEVALATGLPEWTTAVGLALRPKTANRRQVRAA